MTEDLLAFVTVVAVWKIVQVWVLRSRLARKEREKSAVRGELERVSKKLAHARGAIDGWTKKTNPEWPMEWPDEVY